MPLITPSGGEKVAAHQLFQLTAINNGKLPMPTYIKLDLDFLEIMVPKHGVLVTQEPSEILDDCHKIKLPSIIGLNLVKVVYKVFENKYGSQVFKKFDCLTNISLLLFL